MQRLKANGVGAILDFAAESEAEGGSSTNPTTVPSMTVYHESNTAALLSSISSAAKVQADDTAEPFIALKVTTRRAPRCP